MIRFKAEEVDAVGKSRPIIGVGLTKDAIAQLLLGQPFIARFPEYDVIIVAGDNEVKITNDLQKHIGKFTKMHVDPSAIKV